MHTLITKPFAVASFVDVVMFYPQHPFPTAFVAHFQTQLQLKRGSRGLSVYGRNELYRDKCRQFESARDRWCNSSCQIYIQRLLFYTTSLGYTVALVKGSLITRVLLLGSPHHVRVYV